MKTEKRTINDEERTVLVADEGKVFVLKHNGFVMGEEIVLGDDYSTGAKREDKPEYYEEVDDDTISPATEQDGSE